LPNLGCRSMLLGLVDQRKEPLMILKALFGKKEESKIGSVDSGKKEIASVEGETKNATVKGATTTTPPGNPAKEEPPVAELLEKAMIENARADTQETRLRVYQELLFSDLLLVLADPPKDENGATSASNSELSVAILTNPNGTHFSGAFTSAAAARRWRPEGGNYVSMRGQDIFKMLEESPAEVIVINPGSAPFIVLPKIEYRQLALGVMPQGTPSPVHVSVAPPGASEETSQAEADGQIQIAFPPDVFSADQKELARNIMESHANIDAAVLGAILPPESNKESGWVRTVFLRVSGLDEEGQAMQSFCQGIRDTIVNGNAVFQETNFEVGVMPDPNFWVAMHQNSIILFDKNPPELPTQPKAGMVEAELS